MNDLFSKTFVYAVQCYDRLAHLSYYCCFYSSREIAKEHCRLLNENQRTYYFKVKKVRLFDELLIKKVF